MSFPGRPERGSGLPRLIFPCGTIRLSGGLPQVLPRHGSVELRITGEYRTMQTLEIIFKGVDLFVVLDGVKVAKRARLGTPEAKLMPIKPGVTVRDYDGQVEIEYNGKTARVPRAKQPRR